MGLDVVKRELTSWKEIAAYLGVAVRTAQEWERTRGMPVYRLPGPRGGVRSSAEALDQWLHNGNAVNTPLPTVAVAPNIDGRLKLWWRRWWLAGSLILVLLLAAGAWWFLPGPPVAYRITGDDLIVLDRRGREAWRKTTAGLVASAYEERELVWTGDLDGQRVVLFVPVSASPTRGVAQDLYCYDAKGREMWHFTPGRLVQAGGARFAPPFQVHNFRVARLGRSREERIVVVGNHSLYYPCQVALLSPQGRLAREYWHSGQLTDVLVDHDGKRVLLAGISNAARAATLVALDPDTMSGASHEADAAYELQGFGPGREVARLLFPRSCMNRALEPFASMEHLTHDSDGLVIGVNHRMTPSGATLYYHLDDNLSLQQFVVGSSFEQAHAALRATGVLDHEIGAEELTALRAITKAQ